MDECYLINQKKEAFKHEEFLGVLEIVLKILFHVLLMLYMKKKPLEMKAQSSLHIKKKK